VEKCVCDNQTYAKLFNKTQTHTHTPIHTCIHRYLRKEEGQFLL